MLPWLFGVLLVLNLALFYWGYQHMGSREPEPPPLPEGRYEILLISELERAGAETPVGSDTQGEASGDSGDLAPGAETGVDTASLAQPAADATPVSEPAVVETALTGPGGDRGAGETPSSETGLSEPETVPAEPEPQADEATRETMTPALESPSRASGEESASATTTDSGAAEMQGDAPPATEAPGAEAGDSPAQLSPDELEGEPADDRTEGIDTPPAEPILPGSDPGQSPEGPR